MNLKSCLFIVLISPGLLFAGPSASGPGLGAFGSSAPRASQYVSVTADGVIDLSPSDVIVIEVRPETPSGAKPSVSDAGAVSAPEARLPAMQVVPTALAVKLRYKALAGGKEYLFDVHAPVYYDDQHVQLDAEARALLAECEVELAAILSEQEKLADRSALLARKLALVCASGRPASLLPSAYTPAGSIPVGLPAQK